LAKSRKTRRHAPVAHPTDPKGKPASNPSPTSDPAASPAAGGSSDAAPAADTSAIQAAADAAASGAAGPTDAPEPSPVAARRREPLLVEVAWEAVNQLGGIYTVLRSKVPAMIDKWSNGYCLVGPYEPQTAHIEFEEHTPTGPFGNAVKKMQEWGYDVKFGYWLVTGRPRAVLMNVDSVMDRLGAIKYRMWEHHNIATPDDDLINRVQAFGFMVEEFFRALSDAEGHRRKIVGHFHEWMGGAAIPELRRHQLPLGIVFTTHATLLGRYLAMNDPWFYDHLPFVNWSHDADRYRIMPQVCLERAAAHGAHVFTTVSEVTAMECGHLLGRQPDLTLPNGLNIERFVAMHEFQNLHREYKERIHRFTMGHFFASYPFDLENTIYLFTSGRYEFRNKGFDLTIEALARLNHRMREANLDTRVVMFFITRRPFRSINAEVLRRQAVMEELRDTIDHVKEQVGKKLFQQMAMGRTPKLDDLIDEYWRLRLRRTQAAWHTDNLPVVVTHDLLDDAHDDILNQLRTSNLVNHEADPVKLVYHPDFVAPGNPLFGMEYDQFVRGCHLGVFPSYYEPWGYTPLECIARGVPAITSDLSGFGAYCLKNLPDHEQKGIYVNQRRHQSFDQCANQLADWLFDFVRQNRRQRINQRNHTEAAASHFDWHNLGAHYDDAHRRALAVLSD